MEGKIIVVKEKDRELEASIVGIDEFIRILQKEFFKAEKKKIFWSMCAIEECDKPARFIVCSNESRISTLLCEEHYTKIRANLVI